MLSALEFIKNMNFYDKNNLKPTPSPLVPVSAPLRTFLINECAYGSYINYQRVPEITETIYINVSIGCIEYNNISIEDGERM